jgi:hypothetical protein
MGHQPLEMRKPKLIPQWRRAWRMYSVNAMGWGAAMLAAWPAIPEDLKATLSPDWYMRAVAFLLVSGIVGRLFIQEKVTHEDAA